MLLNRDRALGVMKEFRVDALLGTTPVNLHYLSDFSPWLLWFYRLFTKENFMFQSYALFPRDQPPALMPMADGSMIAHLAEWPSWIEDVYPFGPGAAAAEALPHYPPEVHRLFALYRRSLELKLNTGGEAIVRAMRDRGLTSGVVGVDSAGMKPEELEYARQELPHVQFKEAGELFRLIRMVKTPEEIELLRKAGEINRRGFNALLAAAKIGASELDLTSAHRAAVSALGAVPVFCNNACGPFAITHWEPRTYTLKAGDTVYCDAGCTYKYYHADGNVVGILGEPTKRHRELFDAQLEGAANARAKARPGVKISEVLDAFSEGELKSGTVKNAYNFGHALGLEPRDLPMIQKPFWTARDDFINISHDVTLEAGMVFNLEEAQREFGIGSVAVEVTLVTTPSGCEFLLPPPKLETLPVG